MSDWTVKHDSNPEDFKLSIEEAVENLKRFRKAPIRSYVNIAWVVPSYFDTKDKAIEYFKDYDWVVLIDKDSNIWWKGRIATQKEVYGNY